jgi:hypothetical protein
MILCHFEPPPFAIPSPVSSGYDGGMSEERRKLKMWSPVVVCAAAVGILLCVWNTKPRKAPVDPNQGYNAEPAIEEFFREHPEYLREQPQ